MLRCVGHNKRIDVSKIKTQIYSPNVDGMFGKGRPRSTYLNQIEGAPVEHRLDGMYVIIRIYFWQQFSYNLVTDLQTILVQYQHLRSCTINEASHSESLFLQSFSGQYYCCHLFCSSRWFSSTVWMRSSMSTVCLLDYTN